MIEVSIDNTEQKNLEICAEEISKLREETEQDDCEIFSESFSIGNGLVRLSIVITRTDAWEYNLIHYQVCAGNDDSFFYYVVDYKLKDAHPGEMMKYCLKYPFKYHAERY